MLFSETHPRDGFFIAGIQCQYARSQHKQVAPFGRWMQLTQRPVAGVRLQNERFL
jgi:hypothetical protein